MADACDCAAKGRNVLVFACSGGANVAEIADRAAREVMSCGKGSMFCLAGVGAAIGGMVQTARDADLNVVIDGCPVDCAKKVFDNAGLSNYRHVRVTDLGIQKIKGVRAADEHIATVVNKVCQVIEQPN